MGSLAHHKWWLFLFKKKSGPHYFPFLFPHPPSIQTLPQITILVTLIITQDSLQC